jgi:signal transduction histidine kinase
MRLLIVDLLKLSRVNSNKESFAYHSFEQIISNITSELSQLIKETNTIIKISELPVMFVNKTLMEGILRNLITNSIKFKREVPPIINITAEKVINGSSIIGYNISIQDNGIGFSMEYADKIFEAFYRIDTNTVGTGMGLAIVKKSIDRHNGTINVVSVPGEGTTFTIFLPITQEEVS